MPTVDKKFADRIIEYNGYASDDQSNEYGDNPRCIKIVEYDNAWGGQGYGLVMDGRDDVYQPSEYVRNPRVYWEYKNEML